MVKLKPRHLHTEVYINFGNNIMSDNINYYQTIPDLGIVGRMNTPEEFEKIGFPENMEDICVLDIGCNIGAFLLESCKRGASCVNGIEPNMDWRLLANGISRETGFNFKVRSKLNRFMEFHPHKSELVLLLSILHLVDNPQELLDRAWECTAIGGLMIVEINDRLQKISFNLPEKAKVYGKNKDNRTVYHLVKNNG